MKVAFRFGVPALAGQTDAIRDVSNQHLRLPVISRSYRLKPGLQTLKLLALAFVFILGLAASLLAQPRAVEEAAHRFCAVDIYLDSRGAPLAAYQIEFLVTNGVAKIVGIEGGEHPAFRNSPLYDSKAIQKERVIIAAFSLLSADALPVGKTRIATIHLMISGNVPPAFEAKLQTGADTNGNKISADVTFEKKETK